MIVTALLSLVAGVLTVLAPCVLPFLPVIVGGSLGHGSRRRPYLIAASLAASPAPSCAAGSRWAPPC